MDGYTYVDLFATKGPEYLMVIGMLLLTVPFWFLIRGKPGALARAASAAARSAAQWFRLPEGFLFHQGHAWARPASGDVVAVGMDEFARKLVGSMTGVKPPPIGAVLAQGEPGFEIKSGQVSIPMLSPVDGEVVEVNEDYASSPDKYEADPYAPDAWLIKVKPRKAGSGLKNLLSGEVARRWMDVVQERLMAAAGAGQLGTVYADGGLPVSGMARSINPEKWQEIAEEFLLVR